jgi:hypothetical protein
MLNTDKTTQNILKMAEFFENLPPEKYNQNDFLDGHGRRCICGWVNFKTSHPLPADRFHAADYLGISIDQSLALFGARRDDPTPKQAARVLRHLAVTGEVNWG